MVKIGHSSSFFTVFNKLFYTPVIYSTISDDIASYFFTILFYVLIITSARGDYFKKLSSVSKATNFIVTKDQASIGKTPGCFNALMDNLPVAWLSAFVS